MNELEKTKEVTEDKFRKWCKSKSIYFNKIQVDLSRMSSAGTFTRRQPADFIVSTKENTYYVECKEVLYNDSFPFSRLQQEFKLYTAAKDHSIKAVVLINFIKQNIITCIPISNYIELHKKTVLIDRKKSLKIINIPEEFKFTWKTLKL